MCSADAREGVRIEFEVSGERPFVILISYTFYL